MTHGTQNTIAAAKGAGVERFVLMSALGTTSVATKDLVPYYGAKFAMEQDTVASGLEYTIFRPSFVFGRGGALQTFLSQVRYSPVVTVIGSGKQRIQPIWIDDVAEHFARALDTPAAANKTFEIGGPDIVTWDELYRTIAKVLGKHRALAHIPAALASAGARATQWIPKAPLSADQVAMIEGRRQHRHQHGCRPHLPAPARPARRPDPPLSLSSASRCSSCSSRRISGWCSSWAASSRRTASSPTRMRCSA